MRRWAMAPRRDRHAHARATGEIAGTQLLLNKIELIGKLIGKPTEPSPDRSDAAISPPTSAVTSLPSRRSML